MPHSRRRFSTKSETCSAMSRTYPLVRCPTTPARSERGEVDRDPNDRGAEDVRQPGQRLRVPMVTFGQQVARPDVQEETAEDREDDPEMRVREPVERGRRDS